VEEALGTFVRAKTKLNVVVLDACRNNPFTEKATGKGLAQMDAPPSTLLAYATAPGNVAEDGKGSNGLYTSALLPEIKKPEQRIEDVFKRTRFMVRRQSLGRQIPWESTSLEDDFYFLPPESSVKASEEQLKREIEAELAAWNHVKDAKEPDAFIEYLRTYPSGRYTELAQFRLDQISKPVVVASAPKGINQKVAPGQLRYLTGEFAKWELVNHVRGTKQAFPLKISRHDDHIAVASLGVFGEYVTSQMGAVVSFPGIRYEPGLMLAPADIGIGKTWKSAHKKIGTGNWRGQEDLRLDFRAFAREVITIPAGTFPVYKVQGRGWVSGIATDSGRHYGQSAEFNCLIHAERLVPVQYEELRLGSGYQYKFHQTLTMMEWRPVPST
jgi:hypothetical protein